MNKNVVLVTGVRAPSGLDVIRVLGSNGTKVIATDTFTQALGKYSKYCDQFIVTPAPVDGGKAFVEAIAKICVDQQVTHIYSICEEAIYISEHKGILPKNIQEQVTNFRDIIKLHNKEVFLQLVNKLGIKSPKTQNLNEAWSFNKNTNKYIVKPNFSRFGTKIKILNKEQAFKLFEDKKLKGHCLQEFIQGQPLSSFAFSYKGEVKLIAHYKANYYSGKAAINFIPVFDEQLDDNINEVSKHMNYSGFIGLDYIESKNGEFYILECNPRCTSGFHFFKKIPNVSEGLLQTKNLNQVIKPIADKSYQLFLAMLVYGSLQAVRELSCLTWLKNILFSRPVVLSKTDLRPFFGQLVTLFYFIKNGISKGISPIESSVVDIKWESNEGDI